MAEFDSHDDTPKRPSTKIMGGSIIFHERLNSDQTLKGLGNVADNLTQSMQMLSASENTLSTQQKEAHRDLQRDIIKTVNTAFSLMVLDEHSFTPTDPSLRESDQKALKSTSGLFQLTAMLKEGKSVEEIIETIDQNQTKNKPLHEAEKTLLKQIQALEDFWVKTGLSTEAATNKAMGDVDSIVLAVQDREQGIKDYIREREDRYDLLGHVDHELYPDPNTKDLPPDLPNH